MNHIITGYRIRFYVILHLYKHIHTLLLYSTHMYIYADIVDMCVWQEHARGVHTPHLFF